MHFLRSFFLSIGFALGAVSLDVHAAGPWGDQGDGTYKNPILPSDYSDPDVIRVDNDYYMVSSTFQLSPGVVVLHSRDLVNWETIGYAIPDMLVCGPKYRWDRMENYKQGIYAPSIRYHDHQFWVFVNSHGGEGFFVCTAKNPAGPWTATLMVDKNNKPLLADTWSDVCPLWDDDGKAYLAAAERGQGLILFQMRPDGRQLLDADVTISSGMGGTRIWHYVGSEGNKLYKWNGYYYLFNVDFQGKGPLGPGCGAYWKRSKNLYGTKADGTSGGPGDPGSYELRTLGRSVPIQGGFVDTPAGQEYYIAQFSTMDVAGRHPCLLPVTWVNGWPIPGSHPEDGNNKAVMAWSGTNPVKGMPVLFPQGSDEFDGATLNPQWQWNHQPRPGFWSLTERPGFLRLKAFKPIEPENFFKAGNTICQRYFKSDSVQADIKVDLSHMADGEEAGLAHFDGGKDYATIGVVQKGGGQSLIFNNNGTVTSGPAVTGTMIYFRTKVDAQNEATFFYSPDGENFTQLGNAYPLKSANYRGDDIGIYNYNNLADAGYIDVDWFHYVFSGTASGQQPKGP